MRIVFIEFPSKFIRPIPESAEWRLTCQFNELVEFVHELDAVREEITENWAHVKEEVDGA